MRHFFVSPHLDDIALSCGGLVHRLVGSGEAVTVVSVCTGDAPIGQALSAAAKHVHWEWQLGDQPYAHRRAEDLAACASLGATAIHLNLLDAVYRCDDTGQPLYERDFIGIPVNLLDWQRHALMLSAKLWAVLAPHQSNLRVYSPLAVGRHVDHSLVRRVLEVLLPAQQITYYEDYPYADKPDALQREVDGLQDAAHSAIPLRFDLSEAEIGARIAAIACYPSQMFALFQKAEAMPERVRAYVARAGGERYWKMGEADAGFTPQNPD
jgi:LmbE family N-acetylglucosaminyl deacetylase